MLLKNSKKILKKAIINLYMSIAKAEHEDKDVLFMTLTYENDMLNIEELDRKFILRYKTTFSPTANCIETIRKEIGYRCLTYRKNIPRMVLLIPSPSALVHLGIKNSKKLLFGNSWKGKSVVPIEIKPGKVSEKVIAEYRIII